MEERVKYEPVRASKFDLNPDQKEQLDRIEKKVDRILELVMNKETSINDGSNIAKIIDSYSVRDKTIRRSKL